VDNNGKNGHFPPKKNLLPWKGPFSHYPTLTCDYKSVFHFYKYKPIYSQWLWSGSFLLYPLSCYHITTALVTYLCHQAYSWIYSLQPWRRMQYVSTKSRYPPPTLYNVTIPEYSILETSDFSRFIPIFILIIWSYPCNRPRRPIGLWDVEAVTFSRQSAHRWRWGQF
jgi:hypothetical protein